ncbi:MAG TPA: DNA polymerase III subunit delta [Solirubrobacteraceae bacterium]|nr:DNA polymerase III subunit delta [Solirubrobacteraceae bacterium]
MAELKPAYLIHGDDHGAVAERRAGLKALAEGQGDAASVEVLDGEAGTPAGVALALSAMTFAIGRRVILVDGVERWKRGEVEEHLAPAMGAMPPDTTVALFAREESRSKAPEAVREAVKRAGGQVVAQATVKPWELPKWAREQATRMGISLDAAAANALVAQVGGRQQRLLRELEKLALEVDVEGETQRVSVEEIDRRAAHSAEWRSFALADALVAGDTGRATLAYLRVRRQGERLAGLTYLMAQRVRDALAISLRLQAGESVGDVRRGLRMPPRAAERFVADVARSDPDRLRRALGALADLELDSRGGAAVGASRSPLAMLDEDTIALRAIEVITT